MIYRVEVARSRVKKQLRRIPKTDLTRIATAVNNLATEPYPKGAAQLQKDVYRLRVGNYRIIYKVYDKEKLVLIGRIARRGEDTDRAIAMLFD